MNVVSLIMSEQEWRMIGRRLKASPQQVVITRLLIEEGLSSKEIATRLGITKKAVDKQLARLYAKLEVPGRMGLTKRVWLEEQKMRGRGKPE